MLLRRLPQRPIPHSITAPAVPPSGGFQIVNRERNWIVAGERYDLSADDVIEFCEAREP